MFFYIYKTLNKINNKIYIGVHSTQNLEDGYLGSGKILQYAIKKYGIENFEKEILQFFECMEDAYKMEGLLVTEDFIKRNDVYNIKLGGLGGFYHINKFPVEERINIIKLREKIDSGVIQVGGKKNWSEESYEKAKKQLILNSEKNRELGLCIIKGDKHTEESKKKMSEKATGNNNSNYGKKWYIDENSKNIKERKTFYPGSQPINFITCEEWRRNKLKKTHSTYGLHWYNNGITNVLCKENEVPDGYIRGRINT